MTFARHATVTLLFTAPANVHANPSLECSFIEDTQVEIAECLIEAEERANAAMELVLGYALDAAFDLDETTGRKVALPALEAAQGAWLDYREKSCAHRGALFGGSSGTAIAIRSCHIEMTRARTSDLYALLD
ncbi:MAG: lysozyme inhibitor LprI family protein [Pseudomonadota bacterium]